MELVPTRPNALTTTQIDIGAAFEFARNDPEWLSKYAMHGLVLFIPVAGALAYFGWGRRIYHMARSGDRGHALPTIDLGGEISDGIAPFVAMLNVVVVILPMVMLMPLGVLLLSVLGGLLGETGQAIAGLLAGLLVVGFYALFFVVIMAVNLLSPEIQRRGYNGEMGPLFSFGRSVRAIRANPGAFLMTFVGVFVAQLIGSIGTMACWVGVIFTAPFGHAMAAHILAQWDSIAERTP